MGQRFDPVERWMPKMATTLGTTFYYVLSHLLRSVFHDCQKMNEAEPPPDDDVASLTAVIMTDITTEAFS